MSGGLEATIAFQKRAKNFGAQKISSCFIYFFLKK
jgi:hypothetical protein